MKKQQKPPKRRLLIIGCGDIARRTLPHLLGRFQVFAMLREPAQSAYWRDHGARPVVADLDQPFSLKRLAGLADIVLHFAPPNEHGIVDTRMRRLIAALCRGQSLPQRLIYISTSGVYGDCGGEGIDETRPLRPSTARAKRRADAERQLRRFGSRHTTRVSILRAPGIYAADRLPIARLNKGVHALGDEADLFTNRIRADDLAMLVCAALPHGRPNRCYNASDDTEMKMGEYFDLVADRFGLPRPPRISRAEAQNTLSPIQLSFMSESRRLANQRIKAELRAQLRFPQVEDGINAACSSTMFERKS